MDIFPQTAKCKKGCGYIPSNLKTARKFSVSRRAIEYIESHLDVKPDPDRLAEASHYSKYHLHHMTEAAKLLVFSDKRMAMKMQRKMLREHIFLALS